jgi:hypothetical protein
MNLLELIPSFDRHLRQYRKPQDTDSKMAGYLADGIEALNYRWDRDYIITVIAPETYSVLPDITAKDKRPIILMGSIIYKMGNYSVASFTDGDFSYDPQSGGRTTNPIILDLDELKQIAPPASRRLSAGFTAPMRGYENVYNTEGYSWGSLIEWIIT